MPTASHLFNPYQVYVRNSEILYAFAHENQVEVIKVLMKFTP
ncbi:hypothetical protein HMPREF1568_0578 [Providencia alcalifaciens PAL-3]|nr:hypothetical protein HMPREF1568_0578 [Providencia alcalifaciens PAL-3]